MVRFIDSIICYLMEDAFSIKDINQEATSANPNKTDKKFALKLYKNSNVVAFKTQIHSFLHNATSFIYGAAVREKYCFDFSCPCIDKRTITELGLIDISQNHPWDNLWNLALT